VCVSRNAQKGAQFSDTFSPSRTIYQIPGDLKARGKKECGVTFYIRPNLNLEDLLFLFYRLSVPLLATKLATRNGDVRNSDMLLPVPLLVATVGDSARRLRDDPRGGACDVPPPDNGSISEAIAPAVPDGTVSCNPGTVGGMCNGDT
jgi:hypothetical protein